MNTKKRFNFNDFVDVKTKNKNFQGNILPSSNKNTLFLKLESGYNIGIDKKDIKNMKILKKYTQKQKKQEKLAKNKDLPTISILHTGGTVASKVDYETGAVTARFTPEDLIEMFPELKNMANINSKLISNMWSDDMRFSHYNLIAKEIQKEIKNKIDGIIITHGTDTMHYTAAALAFILEDLPAPVIIVGAQRSSDRGSSDAFLNLNAAFKFITKTNFAGVAICMHENQEDETCLILPATKTRKLHSSRRDAFKPINDKPIARIFKDGKIEFIKKDYQKKEKRNLKLKLFKENLKIGILKIHTNMYPEQFLAYKNFNGLIIEGTGLGHTPLEVLDKSTKIHEKIKNAIKILTKKMPVVITTQTIFGRINMNVYSKGRDLQELGIVGNLADMTTETAFIKLAWLISNYPKQVKELITKNLRGEINDRIVSEEFLKE